MIQRPSTGHVGIEDSADGSAMLRSTSSVTTVVPEDTGGLAEITVEQCVSLRRTVTYCRE